MTNEANPTSDPDLRLASVSSTDASSASEDRCRQPTAWADTSPKEFIYQEIKNCFNERAEAIGPFPAGYSGPGQQESLPTQTALTQRFSESTRPPLKCDEIDGKMTTASSIFEWHEDKYHNLDSNADWNELLKSANLSHMIEVSLLLLRLIERFMC